MYSNILLIQALLSAFYLASASVFLREREFFCTHFLIVFHVFVSFSLTVRSLKELQSQKLLVS